MQQQANQEAVKDFLLTNLKDQVNDKGIAWLDEKLAKLSDTFSQRQFFMFFGAASRFFPKDPFILSKDSKAGTLQLRKGWQPDTWNQLQVARTILLLMVPADDAETFIDTLDKLFETADMDEQVALYTALPVLSYPDKLIARTADGIRTNMTVVFDAIALHNPYPADYLSEKAWNQMVLKAFFMQRPIYKIEGADRRANPELARILTDFAHERWAAHRKVMPELWRFVGPYLSNSHVQDLQKVLEQNEPLEKEAAILASIHSDQPEVKALAAQYPETVQQIQNDELDWHMIGQKYHS